MPTHTFSSPEAHAAAVQNANLRIRLQAKSCAPWTISSLNLHNLKVQWGQVGGGTLVEGAVSPGAALIFVPTQNSRAMRVDGRRLDGQTFRFQLPGEEFCLSSTDWHGWFSIMIPTGVLEDWNATSANYGTSSSGFIRLPLDRAEAFQRMVAQLGSIVQQTPGAFDSTTAIKTTARKLMERVRDALWGRLADIPHPGRRTISRMQIIRAAMDFLDKHACEYLTVEALATAAGVSERTLRTAFQDYFGIGPVGFLKLRTLNLVRKTLENAAPSMTTVTEAAMQFGVWELGRFAQDYRHLFGELPSATLRRQL
jgi:AraC family ethanolamine operon transcriptional activator